MNAAELFLLGRKLMQVAEDALPRSEGGTSGRLVLLDVAYHPGSSISEITRRTGFPQSHVSSSVARLRQLGVVSTEADPSDRRRTLVRVTPLALERGRQVRGVPLEQVLAPALPSEDRAALSEVLGALELLARHLTPRVARQLRAEASA